MDTLLSMFIVLISATAVLGQRPFFAGSRPIGFPETPNRTTEGLADRFGEVDGTTPKLPIEANGDLELIDRLSKLPVDQQPFWFINWQAYEANRENPQTYPQRPNTFIDPVPSPNNANSPSVNAGVANPNSASNSNTATSNSVSTANRFGESSSNSDGASTSQSVTTANRFGGSDSNSDVKPTASSALNENKNGGDSEAKPATANSVSTINSESTANDGSTPNPGSTASYGTTVNPGSTSNSDSKSGSKLQQVTPVVPSPVAPPSTVKYEPIVKDDSIGKRRVRQQILPMYGQLY